MPEPAYIDRGATFDRTRRYRYRLWRTWDRSGPRLLFIMLNPSTADAEKLDPTVRRCVGFAERWGYGSLEVANLFALRSTDAGALYQVDDPVGPENDRHIEDAVRMSACVIAAWGHHGRLRGRDEQVQELVTRHADLSCLRRTKHGFPGHPLYLPGSLEPIVYKRRRAASRRGGRSPRLDP
jgi:hypothetical protein